MVFGALKFHIAASWALLLLLAAATQPVDATTSSTIPCSAIQDACFGGDTECAECAASGVGDAYLECLTNYGGTVTSSDGTNYDGTLAMCAAQSAMPCCYDSASANDCLENSAFVEMWLCWINNGPVMIEYGECTALTCIDDDAEGAATGIVDDDTNGDDGATGEAAGDDTNGTDGVGFSCPNAMLKVVLWLAILTATPLLTVSL